MIDIAKPKKTAEEDEPEWIRDPRVAIVDAKPKELDLDRMVAEICEGEIIHCEHCGEKFPLWPPVKLSDHILTAHGENLTLYARAMMTVMCGLELDTPHQMLFSSHFAARTSMRRRAWKLGYTVVREAENIVKPFRN
jgi:hypothetical protein